MLRRKNWWIAAMLFINWIPYFILFFRLIRILIHEAGKSENPYPGSEDPLGPEFAVGLFLMSLAASMIPLVFTKHTLLQKFLILFGVVVAHAVVYVVFIYLSLVAAMIVTGRSM
jgi:hypothetical protein